MNTQVFERVIGRCGGRPTFKGTRIEPRHIAGMVRNGVTVGEIMEDYDLTQAQIRAAIAHVKEHGGE